jgi:hypothetical protein
MNYEDHITNTLKIHAPNNPKILNTNHSPKPSCQRFFFSFKMFESLPLVELNEIYHVYVTLVAHEKAFLPMI